MAPAGWLADFIAAERLPAEFAQTVEALHRPLATRIAGWAAPGRTTVVGVCGAQGSGKSTLCAVIARLLAERGLTTSILSLDDLYLTKAERQALAGRIHPLFAVRGPPGTHDVALGLATLDALAASGVARLPRFDKARDDRRPEAEWDIAAAPVDVVLFEGWCVGARPQPASALVQPVNALERDEDPDGVWRTAVNTALAGPYQALFARLDRLIFLQAPNFEAVAAWREEQEAKLRTRLANDGGAGRAMTPVEVARFIQVYERLTRQVLTEMPNRADVALRLDARRDVLP